MIMCTLFFRPPITNGRANLLKNKGLTCVNLAIWQGSTFLGSEMLSICYNGNQRGKTRSLGYCALYMPIVLTDVLLNNELFVKLKLNAESFSCISNENKAFSQQIHEKNGLFIWCY
jgi:hypothetical protein